MFSNNEVNGFKSQPYGKEKTHTFQIHAKINALKAKILNHRLAT